MKKRVNISLDEDTIIELKELAKKSHKNVSKWISVIVWQTAEKNKKARKNNG